MIGCLASFVSCFKAGFYTYTSVFISLFIIFDLVQSERGGTEGGVFDQSGVVCRPAASTDFLTAGWFGLFCFW